MHVQGLLSKKKKNNMVNFIIERTDYVQVKEEFKCSLWLGHGYYFWSIS